MSHGEELSLSGLANGALEERFQEELAKLLRNIDDPNTEAAAKRELVVKISFHPSKSRQAADVTVQVASKLAPHKAVETHAFIALDMRAQRWIAREHNPEQRSLDLGDEAATDDPIEPGRKPS
jgi:hypothetical protein